MNPRLIYVCEATSGGIAEYVIHQVQALEDAGVRVCLLCRPDFPRTDLSCDRVMPVLPRRRVSKSKLARIINYITDARAISRNIKQAARQNSSAYILLDAFREYLSPFWAGPIRQVHKSGHGVGVMTHDPVRDFIVGPKWWHKFSIRTAYSFVDDVFVHDAKEIDFGGPQPAKIGVHSVPHGPYSYSPPLIGREGMRKKFKLDNDDVVFLCFGQIRDGKNLDRFLRAMEKVDKRVRLVVAGSGGAGSQKSPEYYVSLAKELGVSERCAWEIRYIPDEEVADLFLMSDVILLTYSKAFVSASGVLNSAINFEKPVLASGGEGTLKSDVQNYNIGVWIDPDDDESLIKGIQEIICNLSGFDYDPYKISHSWERNAAVIREAVLENRQPE